MPNAVAEGLRRRGRDATTSKDADLVGASDERQLGFALSEGRILVTRDRDLLVLHAAGVEHAGIVYWTEKRTLGQLVRDLDSLCFDQNEEDLRGQVTFL